MNWRRNIRVTRTSPFFEDGTGTVRCRSPLWQRIRAAMRRARSRARLRADLTRLDERAIHDMGTRRLDLEAEAAKPFWRH